MFYSLANLYRNTRKIKMIEMLAQSHHVPIADMEKIYRNTQKAIEKIKHTGHTR